MAGRRSAQPDRPGGAFLFAPPRVGGGYLPTWPTGRYRVEWLGTTASARSTFRVAGRFATGRPASPRSSHRIATCPARSGPVPVADDERLFAVTRGVAAGLAAPGTVPLDAARAWQDASGRPAATTHPEAAAAFLPEANGLGVLLPRTPRARTARSSGSGRTTVAVDAQRSLGVRFARRWAGAVRHLPAHRGAGPGCPVSIASTCRGRRRRDRASVVPPRAPAGVR